MTDEQKISALCARLGQAHQTKDAGAIVACYAPDALIYSLAPPLGSTGVDRDEIAAWLATWDGPVTVDGENVEIVARDGIAWLTALNRMRGVKIDGAGEDLWFRTTMCFREIGGEWLIVHEHTSTPFYMDGSLKAAVDLKPSIASS